MIIEGDAKVPPSEADNNEQAAQDLSRSRSSASSAGPSLSSSLPRYSDVPGRSLRPQSPPASVLSKETDVTERNSVRSSFRSSVAFIPTPGVESKRPERYVGVSFRLGARNGLMVADLSCCIAGTMVVETMGGHRRSECYDCECSRARNCTALVHETQWSVMRA